MAPPRSIAVLLVVAAALFAAASAEPAGRGAVKEASRVRLQEKMFSTCLEGQYDGRDGGEGGKDGTEGTREAGEGSTREGREWERGGEMREGSGKRKRGKGGVDEEKDDGRSRPCKGRKGGE
jgi:hypothetical protein